MPRTAPTAEDARIERARARASWPIRKSTLGEHVDEDLSGSTTADERLAMMERLTLDAWASTGRPWPSYSRSEIPGRIVRNRHGRSGA